MVTHILLRRDTAANWASINPVLSLAEEGVETDTLRRKIGDGVTTWTALPYSTVTLADLHDPASPPSVALKAALVPFWAAAETVTAGTVRMSPTGVTITRNANGTTRGSYDATEQALWTVVSGGAGGTAVSVDGTAVSTLNIDSTPVTAASIGADAAGAAAAAQAAAATDATSKAAAAQTAAQTYATGVAAGLALVFGA